MIKKIINLLFTFIAFASLSYAQSGYNEIYLKYPKSGYLVGTGEAPRTDNVLKDRRIAEIMARLEIAKQIKVRMKEETVDIMCEGNSKIFQNVQECRNEFVMIIEVTVDEFLQGSSIADHGERDNLVYAVAILPRGDAVKDLQENTEQAINRTKEEIEKAKQGDKDSAEKAKEEYMRALAYDKEKEIIEGVINRSSGVFEELEKEIGKLKGLE